MHDQEANSWVMYDKKEMGYGNIVSTYTMYVSKVQCLCSFVVLAAAMSCSLSCDAMSSL